MQQLLGSGLVIAAAADADVVVTIMKMKCS